MMIIRSFSLSLLSHASHSTSLSAQLYFHIPLLYPLLQPCCVYHQQTQGLSQAQASGVIFMLQAASNAKQEIENRYTSIRSLVCMAECHLHDCSESLLNSSSSLSPDALLDKLVNRIQLPHIVPSSPGQLSSCLSGEQLFELCLGC
jgi:hypothetical protein